MFGGLTAEYVVDSVAEIFVNALTHAHSDVGVVASGHYFRAREQLELSVLDLGIGIPASIAARLDRREDQIDPARAIAWAFKRGSSSVRTSRGLGLATFYDFLARSEATLVVLSGRGAGRLAGGMWETFTLPTRFPGTLFDLTVPTAKVQRPGAPEGTI